MPRHGPRSAHRAFPAPRGKHVSAALVGATQDHTVPASLTKAQYKRYERSSAKTDYLEFEGRPHLHMVASDWQEVAAAIDSWLDGVLDAPIASSQQGL